MRPCRRVRKFIFSRAPGLHFLANIFRHARAGRQVINESFGIVLMRLPDFRAPGVRSLGIFVIGANEIRGKAAVIVYIGFTVRHPNGIP